MLCLGRNAGEGIVIDNHYLLVIGEAAGQSIHASLYKKNSTEGPVKLSLRVKQPHSITENIRVTFLGWRQWGVNAEHASIGIDAPRSIPIMRCELMAREELKQ